MGRTCTICWHKRRNEIESALLAGTAFRQIAGRFDTTASSLVRHKKSCLLPVAQRQIAEAEETRELNVKNEVIELYARLKGFMVQAEVDARSGNWGALQTLNSEARKTIELLAKMTGEIGPRGEAADGRSAIVVIVPSLPPSTIRQPVIAAPETRQLPAPGNEVIDISEEQNQ